MAAILFGTDGWRAIIAQDYTYENLARVVQAMELWLKKNYPNPSVMIGHDCRFGGTGFARATANQLAQAGIKVFLAPDYVSTPMVSLATMQRQCSAGIVITASHNPPEYNGFKVKGHFGGPAFPSMIAEIESLVPATAPMVADQFDALLAEKQIEYYDAEALFQNQLKQAFDWPTIRQSGIRVGTDAMYGAGQRILRKIFPEAIHLHSEYNPSFKGQAPEPIEKNLQEFKQLMVSKNLQFGLATDGDADRIGLYDHRGQFIDSHHILLLLVHYLHKYKGLTGKVVYTFSCTGKIKQMCEHYGLPYEVTKIGFKYIGEIMSRENVLVGGEESGGIAVTGHIPERDGIYVGLVLLEFMAKTGKSLCELIEEVYGVVGRFAMDRNDLHLTEADKQRVIANCKSGAYKQFGTYPIVGKEDLDGFKFHLPEGRWVLIRPSGTEPVLRVYAEAENLEEVQKILAATVKEIL
jgi:phosphomannomutase